MINALLLAVCSLLPQPEPIVDALDLAEVNHFYDDKGKHVFDQIIFYEWCDTDCRHKVVAWRLFKSDSQWPIFDARRSEYRVTWHDGDKLRLVRVPTVRQTWTQFDPELNERTKGPAREERRELGNFRPVE